MTTKRYKVKCPYCGKVNKNLLLEETDGWMICEECGKEYKVADYKECVKVPVYKGNQLAAIMEKH